MSDKIRHEYTDNIVCPHCGHVRLIDVGYDEDSGTEKCKKCGKEYRTKLKDGYPTCRECFQGK